MKIVLFFKNKYSVNLFVNNIWLLMPNIVLRLLQEYLQGDASKAQKALGWKATTTFEVRSDVINSTYNVSY